MLFSDTANALPERAQHAAPLHCISRTSISGRLADRLVALLGVVALSGLGRRENFVEVRVAELADNVFIFRRRSPLGRSGGGSRACNYPFASSGPALRCPTRRAARSHRCCAKDWGDFCGDSGFISAQFGTSGHKAAREFGNTTVQGFCRFLLKLKGRAEGEVEPLVEV